jgi:hypothetical protein
MAPGLNTGPEWLATRSPFTVSSLMPSSTGTKSPHPARCIRFLRTSARGGYNTGSAVVCKGDWVAVSMEGLQVTLKVDSPILDWSAVGGEAGQRDRRAVNCEIATTLRDYLFDSKLSSKHGGNRTICHPNTSTNPSKRGKAAKALAVVASASACKLIPRNAASSAPMRGNSAG